MEETTMDVLEERVRELEIRVAVVEKLIDIVTKRCDEAIIKASVSERLAPYAHGLDADPPAHTRRFDADLDLTEPPPMPREDLPPRRIPSPYELNIAGLPTANPEKPRKVASFGSASDEAEEDLRTVDDE